MLVLWEQTPPGVPQTCYLSIVTAQIFSKQLTENRLYASAFYLKDMLEMLFREDMSRLHFWCCITMWVQFISNYKGKQGEEDWEGRSWAENRWKCCWLPPVHTHCQKQGHAILSFCIVKNLKGKRALSFQECKWLQETISHQRLLPKMTKSFSNYEDLQDLEHHCWFSPSLYEKSTSLDH